jgi:hypothetical protein
MADLAQILLEIARKKGYNDGDEVQIKHTGPISLEDRTIQVFIFSWVDYFGYLLLGCSVISVSFII